jgi:hypothetical protein
MGPFAIQSKSPIQILRTSIDPQSPYLLEKGHVRYSFDATWVNIWGVDKGKYLFDAEVLTEQFKFAYGVNPWCELEFSIQSVFAGGGYMDSFIENFHDTFYFGDHYRPDYPRNVFQFEVETPDGESFSFSENSSQLSHYRNGFQVAAKFNIMKEPDQFPELAVMLFCRESHKTRDRFPGKDNTTDWGWSLIAGKTVGDFVFYLNYGETYLGETELGPIKLRSTQRNYFGGVEYKIAKNTSFILQSLVVSKAAVDCYVLSKGTVEAYFGIKHRFSENFRGDFAIIENLYEYFNSPDVGFFLGCTYTF